MTNTLNHIDFLLSPERAALCTCHTFINPLCDNLTLQLAHNKQTLDNTQDTIARCLQLDWLGKAADNYQSELQQIQTLTSQLQHIQSRMQELSVQVQA